MSTLLEREDRIEDWNKWLCTNLKCSVCFVFCSDEIYICESGHNVCNECQSRSLEPETNLKCSLCRGKISSSRSLFAEKVSQEVLLPCKNRFLGCLTVAKSANMSQHLLEECDYTYDCKVDVGSVNGSERYRCSWLGRRSALWPHVLRTHPGQFANGACFERERTLSDELPSDAVLIRSDGSLLWSVVEWTAHSDLEAYVQLVGSRKEAYRFKYLYIFYPRGSYVNRFTYKGTVLGQGEKIAKGFNSMLLKNDNLLLTYRVGNNLKYNLDLEFLLL